MMEMTDPSDALRIIRDSDEPPSAHLSALQFLSKLSFDEYPPGCLPSVLSKLDSPDERIRETVLVVLEHVDPSSINSRVLAAVVKRLNDPNETAEVKVAASRVVGMVDPEELDGVLAEEQQQSQRSSRSSRSFTDEAPPTLRERVVQVGTPAAKGAAALTSAIGRGIRRATSFERLAPAKSSGQAAGGDGPKPTPATETPIAPAAAPAAPALAPAPPPPAPPPVPPAPPAPPPPSTSANPAASAAPPPSAAPPAAAALPPPPPVRILGRTGAINPATQRFEEAGASNPVTSAGQLAADLAADAGSSASHAGRAQFDFVRSLKFGRRSISAAASAAAAAASALSSRGSTATSKASGPGAATVQLPEDLERALHPGESLQAASAIAGSSGAAVSPTPRAPPISKAAKAEARAKAEEVLHGSLDVSSDDEPVALPQEEMGYLE